MDTARIMITHAVAGEFYPNEKQDFEWVKAHRSELLAKHGACVLLVYQQQVVGTGKTLKEAINNAERDLPGEVERITPVVEFLAHRRPIFGIRLKSGHE